MSTIKPQAPSQVTGLATSTDGQSPQLYVVQPGDTASVLALRFYGDASRWSEIRALNPKKVSATGFLRAGETLVIRNGSGHATTYKPYPGDTLAALALRFLGDAKRWPEIRDANPGKVGDNGEIKAGVPLTMPITGPKSGTPDGGVVPAQAPGVAPAAAPPPASTDVAADVNADAAQPNTGFDDSAPDANAQQALGSSAAAAGDAPVPSQSAAQLFTAKAAPTPVDPKSIDAKTKQGLGKLGLTVQDLVKNPAAAPAFKEAAQKAADGDYLGALDVLADASAAASAPKPLSVAMKTAAAKIPDGLVKTLLTDPAVIDELATDRRLQGSIAKVLLPAKRLDGIRELIGNDLIRNAVLSDVGNDPAVTNALSRIGLTSQDLVDAGRAAPGLWDSVAYAAAGKYKEALTALQGAIQSAPQLSGKLFQKFIDKMPPALRQQFQQFGIGPDDLKAAAPVLPQLYDAVDAAAKGDSKRVLTDLGAATLAAAPLTQKILAAYAQKLPAGVAKSVLTDPAVIQSLTTDPTLYQAAAKLFDPAQRMAGLKSLVSNQTARDATLNALGNDPTIKADLAKVGLEPADLVQAGAQAPTLLDAIQCFTDKKYAAGLADIRQAAAAGSPVATKVMAKLASNLPDGLAKTVLTNPAFINEWLTDADAQNAVAKLFDPKTMAEGAKALLANPNVQKVTFDAVTSDPGVQKRLAQIGLTPDDLRAAGPAVPQILQAVQDASDKKWSAFFTDLKGIASSASPVVTKLVAKVGGTLPQGLAKTLLTNQAFVQQLLTDADAQTAVGQLFDEKTRMQGVKTLLNDAPTRDATLKALGSDPGITADLAKIGMTPDDLVGAGAAAPSLLNAVTQASAKDYRGAFASITDAMKAAPTITSKLAQKFFKALPPATQQQLTAAGITSDDFAQSAAALPQIGNALQDFADKKYPAMLQDLRAAASAGAPVVSKLLGQLASNLPDGVAKTVLTNPAFINLWLTNPAIQDAVVKLFDEKTRAQGTKELLTNPDLQKATFDAVTSDKTVQAKLAALGLTADDLRSAGPAAPLLYQAALDAGNKQWGAALNDVRHAAAQAPQLVSKVVGKLAGNLPDGLAKTLLSNQPFVQQWLTDTAAQDGVAKLFTAGTRMDGIKALLGDAALRGVALDAISSDAGVQAQLAKVGLTADDLKQAGAAAPSLWAAAEQLSQKQWKEGLQSLADAYKAAPDLAKKIGNRVIDALPPEIKAKLQGGSGGLGLTGDDLAAGQAALPALLEAQQDFEKGQWKEGLHALGQAELTAAPVVQKVLAAAAQKLPAGVAKSVLTNPDVLKELTGDKALYDSIGKLFDPATRLDGIKELIHNNGARQAVLTALASDPTVKTDLAKVGLTPDMLVQAGAAAPHIFDAAAAAKAGDWNTALTELAAAADAAPAVLTKISQAIFDKLPPDVKSGLQSLGLTRDDLGEAAAAMPHFVAAGQLLAKGQAKQALAEIGQATEAAPTIVAKAVKAASAKLPDGFAKALFSDPGVITALVRDPSLHAAFKQMAAGTTAGIEAGLRSIAGNSAAMSAVGNALWNDKVTQADLQKLGFQSADDIAKAGASLADVIQLRDDIAGKNWKGALTDLDALWKGLPEGVQTKAITALCKELKIPSGIAILITQGGEVFHDPAVREKLSVAIDALKRKDTRGFVTALADTAEVINTNHPDQAVAFLDALGTLPGGLGRFYSNHDLNDALVKSGARNLAWEAVKALATGTNERQALEAATIALGKASEALLQYGDPITDQLRGKHPHEAKELDKVEQRLGIRIGDKGLKATALVFKQFWETLPPDLRQEIIDQSEQVAAHAAGHVIPGESLIELPGDAISLEHALRPKNGAAKDHIDILLRSAKLGTDVAGAIPALNEVAGPLNTALEVGEVVKTGFDVYKNVEQLKKQFAFGDDTPATADTDAPAPQ